MYTNYNTILTLDFGRVAIRKEYVEGEIMDFIEDCEGNTYEIKRDFTTNQPFAVKC